MSEAWMVRCGRGSRFIDEFLEHGCVALGEAELGPLNTSTSKGPG